MLYIDFLPSETEFDYVKNTIKNRYNIFSDDDDIWDIEHICAYNKLLDATPVATNNCGHYGRKSKIKEIKELNFIIKNLV